MLFVDANVIQHVPKIKLKHNKKQCWFPFNKIDFPKTKVYFKSDQIQKIIHTCYNPNSKDGTFFKFKKIAGPFCEYTIIYYV